MILRILLTLLALPLTRAEALAQSIVYQHTGDARGNVGHAVGGVGDVNADGVADYAVSQSGTAVTVYSGLNGSVLLVLTAPPEEQYQRSVAGAGDVNRDGHDDVLIGYPDHQHTGTARVYSGADGSLLYDLPGPVQHAAQTGISVSAAGDLNSDSHADFVVGAPRQFGASGSVSAARIYSGIDGSLMFTLQGGTPDSRFGYAVDGGHDLDGDGVPDILVGAPFDVGGPSALNGSVRAFSGADGSLLFTIYGPQSQGGSSAYLGYSLAFLTDINNDGRADFACGAPGADSEDGRVLVYSGAAPSLLFTFHGTLNSEFGDSVSSAGDVDGDGFDDVLVGAPHSRDSDGLLMGRFRLYSGNDGTLLLDVPGSDLLPYTSIPEFGDVVACVGDLNGDSHPEVLVSAPSFHNHSAGENGMAFVLDLFNDCNLNGRHDTWDLVGGNSPDCNTNGVPDECDVTAGTSPDCNANGVPDECDVAVGGASADCDWNGVPDECQIASGVSTDCDGDGVPDACLLPGVPYQLVSPELGNLLPAAPLTYTAPAPTPLSTGNVTVTVSARGDLDGLGEWVSIELNGTHVGNVFERGFPACVDTVDTIAINPYVFNHLVVDGDATFTLIPRSTVSGCPQSRIQVTIDYLTYNTGDCNGNGVSDACDVAGGTSPDHDADGLPDECEFERFCDAAANSTGSPAAMFWSGTNSVSANGLVLGASSLPPSASGLLIYSPDQASVPLGNGVLCLGSTTQGFINRLPPDQSDAGGHLVQLLDLTSPPVPASAITPGSTWNFSCWFRDVPSGGAGFNFSDGLQVTFQP